MLVLPKDANHLGKNPDDLEVAEAVRMSMSIPIFFDPWVSTTTPPPITRSSTAACCRTARCGSSTPPTEVTRWPTFGLLLVAPDQREPLVVGPEPELHGGGKLTGAASWSRSPTR
jgi:NTE family protein